MEKNYSPSVIEQTCYAIWENHRYFEPQGEGKPFCIMLPPPNVTGSLHMGHGFQHSLIDIIIRYQRMMGRRTLWQPGTDHAGIATQLVVEKQLEREGLTRQKMSRDDFLAQVWAWKKTSGGTITHQMRRLGLSADWSRERFTLDKGLSTAVQKVFIQLYDEGLIYRGTRLVNWDPALGTALSDLEVVTSEEQGSLWHIRYPIVDSDASIVIATTRPETMLGDVAVAVHPEDARYQHLIGKLVHLPLCDRSIPIIADDYVSQDFGTGCVKITPAHDFNDYEIGKRHDLPLRTIFTKAGMTNSNVPLPYQHLDRFVVRSKIIQDLTDANFLMSVEPHVIPIPRGEKSNVIIEPLLTEQWYVKTQTLAKPAIQAVRNGDIRFIPAYWDKTYFQWMEHIEDWCISRQLWWGHRIPAWYDPEGHIYVGYTENDIRFKYKLDPNLPLVQDEDVLDTWFSAALWPFSSLGWPEKTADFEQFYPTNVLFTGFDIIFFWVARMIMLGLKFTGKIPFKEVVISGLICDHDGKKMSKSKGNVLDPMDIIDGISLDALLDKRTRHLLLDSSQQSIMRHTQKAYPQGIPAYGTDALRFTFCALAANTRQIRFDLQRVAGYRNFCNKLWNAARFVLLTTAEDQGDFDDGAFQYNPADEWILSLLQKTIGHSHGYFKTYRFDLLASHLYEFIWHEYCDWYLELAKIVLFDNQARAPMKRGTRRTLIYVLTQILKLLHPIMPFITEALWQQFAKVRLEDSDTIMRAAYPQVEEEHIHAATEVTFNWIKSMVQAIRSLRSEVGILPGKMIPVLLRNLTTEQSIAIQNNAKILHSLAKLSDIQFCDFPDNATIYASSVLEKIEILIPMQGFINKASELSRLDKELRKLEKDILYASGQLDSADFIAKAPAERITSLQIKREQAQAAAQKLLIHREKIALLA